MRAEIEVKPATPSVLKKVSNRAAIRQLIARYPSLDDIGEMVVVNRIAGLDCTLGKHFHRERMIDHRGRIYSIRDAQENGLNLLRSQGDAVRENAFVERVQKRVEFRPVIRSVETSSLYVDFLAATG